MGNSGINNAVLNHVGGIHDGESGVRKGPLLEIRSVEDKAR